MQATDLVTHQTWEKEGTPKQRRFTPDKERPPNEGPGRGPGGGLGGYDSAHTGPSKRKSSLDKSDRRRPDKRRQTEHSEPVYQRDPDSLPQYDEDLYPEGSRQQTRLDNRLLRSGEIRIKESETRDNPKRMRRPLGDYYTYTTPEGIEVAFTRSVAADADVRYHQYNQQRNEKRKRKKLERIVIP